MANTEPISPKTVAPPPALKVKPTRAQRKQQAKLARQSPLCLNCGELTPGQFCAGCGQVNDTYRVSTRKLVADFIGDYFTVDLKFFKSALPLLFKPGFLTNEYIAGRRARYISPLRMYLFVSVAYFFILTFSSDGSNSDVTPPDKPPTPVTAPAPQATDPAAVVKPAKPPKTGPPIDVGVRINDEDLKVDTGNQKFDKFIIKSLKRKVPVLQKEGEFERSVLQAFKEHFPKAMFFLMPVFALLLKVLYLRSGKYYAEHLIFTLHFHAFAFALLALATVIQGGMLLPFVPLALLAYLFFAMKAVFRQKALKTAAKFSILLLSYATALTLAFVAIVLVALLV